MFPEANLPTFDELRPGEEGIRAIDADALLKASLERKPELREGESVADPVPDEEDAEER